MFDAALRMLAQILLSRPVRRAAGLSPTHVFGSQYHHLLAAVQARLVASGQATPVEFDDDDKVVTYWYTKDSFDPGLDFRALHQLLRTGSHPNALHLSVLAAYLIEALLKLPSRNAFSYRVIRYYPDFVADYALNSIVTEKGFLSASRNPRIGFPGQIYFTLMGRSGRFIGGMSEFLEEDEILFPPQIKFKVMDIEPLADRSMHVIMEEQ